MVNNLCDLINIFTIWGYLFWILLVSSPLNSNPPATISPSPNRLTLFSGSLSIPVSLLPVAPALKAILQLLCHCSSSSLPSVFPQSVFLFSFCFELLSSYQNQYQNPSHASNRDFSNSFPPQLLPHSCLLLRLPPTAGSSVLACYWIWLMDTNWG